MGMSYWGGEGEGKREWVGGEREKEKKESVSKEC